MHFVLIGFKCMLVCKRIKISFCKVAACDGNSTLDYWTGCTADILS